MEYYIGERPTKNLINPFIIVCMIHNRILTPSSLKPSKFFARSFMNLDFKLCIAKKTSMNYVTL